MTMRRRCGWVDLDNPLYKKYHDEDWGVPVHDDGLLFEMLILEGAQAGLSWSTILAKRENYQKAFDSFDVSKVAEYKEEDVQRLLSDKGIVRNRLKITASIENAKTFIAIQEEFGSFDEYIWGFVGGRVIKNAYNSTADLPAKTKLSEKISKDLKQRGMNFVGPTIIYAFMQAIGMVNNHEISCFRYDEV